jgi:hypothetical protein
MTELRDDGAAIGWQIFQLVNELRDELPRVPAERRFAVLKERLKPYPPEVASTALAFYQLGQIPDPEPASLPPEDALDLWRQKLALYQAEQAKNADPERKFQLIKLIEEAKAEIQSLGG